MTVDFIRAVSYVRSIACFLLQFDASNAFLNSGRHSNDGPTEANRLVEYGRAERSQRDRE